MLFDRGKNFTKLINLLQRKIRKRVKKILKFVNHSQVKITKFFSQKTGERIIISIYVIGWNHRISRKLFWNLVTEKNLRNLSHLQGEKSKFLHSIMEKKIMKLVDCLQARIAKPFCQTLKKEKRKKKVMVNLWRFKNAKFDNHSQE